MEYLGQKKERKKIRSGPSWRHSAENGTTTSRAHAQEIMMSLDGKQYYSVIFDEVGISDADRQGCARAPSPLILLTRLNELRTVRAKEWNSCHVASPAKWGALARIVLASACLPGSRRVMLAPLCLPPPIHSTCTFRNNSRHNWTSQEQPERSARESATTARHHGGHWETRRNN